MKRVFGITLLMALLLWSCHSKKNDQETVAVYTSTTPLVTDINLPETYVANIQSIKNIEVRSQQEGILQQVYVNEDSMSRLGNRSFALPSLVLTKRLPSRNQLKSRHK